MKENLRDLRKQDMCLSLLFRKQPVSLAELLAQTQGLYKRGYYQSSLSIYTLHPAAL